MKQKLYTRTHSLNVEPSSLQARTLSGSNLNGTDKLVPQLLAAAETLRLEGRDASAREILADCVPACSDLQQLEQCLQAAGAIRDLATVEECIARGETMTRSVSDNQAFLARARGFRFALKAEQYLDDETHFRTLLLDKGFQDAQRLIFAPINLNAIDGSSIWMASMIRILARTGKVIVVSQNALTRDAVVGDLVSCPDVLFLTPGNAGLGGQQMSVEQCADLIRQLDNDLPRLDAVIVRGLDAAKAVLSDRQLYKRVFVYLTDIYVHDCSGIALKPEASAIIDVAARQAAGYLVQTPGISDLLSSASAVPTKHVELPPPIPDDLIGLKHKGSTGTTLQIGYAGKIAPQWGVRQLIAWAEMLRAEGIDIEVTIIGDKVSGAGGHTSNQKFREEIDSLLDKPYVKRLGAMERSAAMQQMQEMDYAWCWRPPEFENATLELSTKLIENVAAGIPSIAYPNAINTSALGADYPFFAVDLVALKAILKTKNLKVSPSLRKALHDKHSFEQQAARIADSLDDRTEKPTPSVAVAAHDFKFCHPYFSTLKKQGTPIIFDDWEWGSVSDHAATRLALSESKILFCEWGLANAVWYARNKRPDQRLVVRVHAQEVRLRAQKFGRQLDHKNVDCFVFVSDWVRQKAIELFSWPEEKTTVIPNFLLDEEYSLQEKSFQGPARLGMVGIIPSTKRLDRALDLVDILTAAGISAELHLKGPMPHDLPFMHAPGRVDELREYDAIFARIANSSTLSEALFTHAPGNDVASFYDCVDHILSPSETESFHYSLADGVLSGCQPVIWEREDAARIYSADWISHDTQAAAQAITDFRTLSAQVRKARIAANRDMLISRYGASRIYSKLDQVLFGEKL